MPASKSFEDAEGFGRFAMGGRGGDVVKVTNTKDSGVGSFRWAVEELGGPRYVVFEVNRVKLDEDVGIVKGDVTIAGQSADGVEISGGSLRIRDGNVIIQGLKIRPGDDPGGDSLDNRDALTMNDSNNLISDVMIDNNSFQWAPDEVVHIGNNVRNVSFTNNIVAQGLHDLSRSKIEYGKGLLVKKVNDPSIGGPEKVTIAHNLFAFNYDRNPRVEEAQQLELVNNFTYAPGHQHWATDINASDGQPPKDVIIKNNVYKAGPETTRWNMDKPFIRNGSDKGIYIAGNEHTNKDGNDIDQQWHGRGSTVDSPTFSGSGVTTRATGKVESYVLANAGAMPGDRDSVDRRIIDAVKAEGTGIVGSPREAGGYANESFTPAKDSDDDGMPDWYEEQQGLNKNAFNANGDADGNGYTNLEDYLFGLLNDFAAPSSSGSGSTTEDPPSSDSGSSDDSTPPSSDSDTADSTPVSSGDSAVIGSVQAVNDLRHTERTIDFGTSLDDPVVFATPVTLDGGDPVTTRITNLTGTGATLRLDEPNYLDESHTTEDLTLLALEEGVFDLGGGRRLEVGTVQADGLSSGGFTSVAFKSSFDEAPVVVAQIQTDNGGDWVVPRLDDVVAGGFKVAMQEPEAKNNDYHVTETIGWVAIEADVFDWSTPTGSVDTQAFTTGRKVDDDGTVFEFASAVGGAPRLAAGLASFFGPDTSNLRLADLGSGSATFVADEEQSADSETNHTTEDVAGLAFEADALLTGSELFIA